MELPRRQRGDEYAPPGRVVELMRRIGARPGVADVPVACFHAFDFRTRTLPYIFYSRRIFPAGVRAIAAAFHESGFKKTRSIFQYWSPNVRPSCCRIDGQPIQILTVTSLHIHAEASYELIADAWSMGPDRPLILAGGPKAVYEPDHYFGLGPRGDIHVDAAATGEELVLLELLDRVTEHRGRGETMLQAFGRCRDEGLLDDIPGWVYMSRERDRHGRPVLVHTGIQRLVKHFDEFPHIHVGLRLLEPPHRHRTLAPQPLAPDQVHRYGPVVSVLTTRGCKFGCDYCAIPAYNQRTYRFKSPQRLVDEFQVLREQFDIRYFFGTDDNFFNDRATSEAFLTALASAEYKDPRGRSKSARRRIRFGTEATEIDVFKCRDLLPLARDAGVAAIWFGIEDLSAELVNKGQTPEKTIELFRLMRQNGLQPMAMLMHHEAQPLRTGGNNLHGITNQTAFLFRHGAASFQCCLHGPAWGTRDYDAMYQRGIVIKTIDGEPLPASYLDGNHVTAFAGPNPARMQLNLLLTYARFYNPVHLLGAMLDRPLGNPFRNRRVLCQIMGMAGLTLTAARNIGWLYKQSSGRIECWPGPPEPAFPIRRLDRAHQDQTPRERPAAPRPTCAAPVPVS